jgi:hypothetical protein
MNIYRLFDETEWACLLPLLRREGIVAMGMGAPFQRRAAPGESGRDRSSADHIGRSNARCTYTAICARFTTSSGW